MRHTLNLVGNSSMGNTSTDPKVIRVRFQVDTEFRIPTSTKVRIVERDGKKTGHTLAIVYLWVLTGSMHKNGSGESPRLP